MVVGVVAGRRRRVENVLDNGGNVLIVLIVFTGAVVVVHSTNGLPYNDDITLTNFAGGPH